MSLTKIGSIGINTGIQFAGVTTVSTLHVGSGVTLSSDGDGFFTGIITATFAGDGTSLTGVASTDNIRTNTNATFLQNINVSGTVTATSYAGSGANLTGIDTDLVSDTSPQLGGNLDVNTKNIVFGDSGGATDDRLTFGAGTDLSIYHDGSHSRIVDSGTGHLIIQTSELDVMNAAGNADLIKATAGASVELYENGTKVAETTSGGFNVEGVTYSNGLDMDDSHKILLGTDDDLEIFHNGSNAYIKNGTGQLLLRSGTHTFENAAGSTEYARIDSSGNLGIGIASPATLTHIYDSTDTSSATEQFRISGGDRSADTFETGFRFFTQSPSANGNRHYRFIANGNTGLHIQGYETSTGNAASDRQINLNPDGGAVAIGTDRTGAQTWRNGRTLEIAGGGGNNVAQLVLASNRGDGEQTTGSIVFADHTQSSTKRNLAIIECDKKGSTANNRGGSLPFATKSDGSTSPDNAWQMTAGGTYGGSTTDYSTLRHMKGVTSYSSAYNSGDIYIHIDGLYNLPGNAWWYTQVLFQSTEIVGTQAGSHHYLTSLTLMGIAQWNSVGVNNVVGSASVSISASTSTSVTLFVNVNDSSRGPITVWASNTVGQDGPYISFS